MQNHDAGDVSGLEEVFRSQEISQATGSIGSDSGKTAPHGRDAALLRRMFGHAPGLPPATALDATLMRERQPEATSSSGGGAELGAHAAAVSVEPPWKRKSGRYWTIAAFSAVVALVVAGVTAGKAQHGPPSKSAQGAHGTVRQHGGVGSPTVAPTGPTTPGSLTGSIGAGVLALGEPLAGARGSGSGNESGGRVTLIGAATTTGTLPAPAAGSPGGGSSGASPGSGGSNPVTPVAAGVGNTVAAVGTSITGIANQLGSTVPAAAPATGAVSSAVSGLLDSVDQAVGATTL